MRIFSNFDTNQERTLLESYKRGFGDDQVLSIHKSRLFFYKHVVTPYILWIVLVGICLYPVHTTDFSYRSLLVYAFWGCALLYLMVVVYKTNQAYVDYKMDYLIVTPKELIKYNQEGVLHRETENIPASKIKSISVKKDGLMNSFFDIGSIVFLAEGNDDKGDIVMEDIDAVEHMEKQIKRVMGLDRR